MLLSPRTNGLGTLFKEVRVFKARQVSAISGQRLSYTETCFVSEAGTCPKTYTASSLDTNLMCISKERI